MDYTRIYRRQQQAKHTDLILLISDTIQTLEMAVHKIILILHSPFFDKLLEFNDENRLEIHVEDAHITRDLILSFYGHQIKYTNWIYILAMAKCQDYFGVEVYSHEIPEKIEIQDYDYVLEYCGIVGFNNFEILASNLPPSYDISSLSQDLLLQMIDKSALYTITSFNNSKLEIYNPIDGTMITSMDNNTDILQASYVRNGRFITTSSPTEINIWNCIDYTLVCNIQHERDTVTGKTINPDNTSIALSYIDNGIKIYDLSDISQVKIIKGKSEQSNATRILYSHNGLYLMTVHDNHLIKIFETNTYEVTSTVMIKNHIENIIFSVDDEYLWIKTRGFSKNVICILDVRSGKLLPLENIRDTSFISHSLQPRLSNKKYVAIQKDEIIEIVDINHNNEIIHMIEETCTRVTFLPFDRYIVLHGPDIILDILTGQTYLSFNFLSSLEYSLDGKYLALKRPKGIDLWDFYERKIIYSISCNAPSRMTFSPDNKFFAYVSVDNFIKTYDMKGILLSSINFSNSTLFRHRFYNGKLIENIEPKKLDEILKYDHI